MPPAGRANQAAPRGASRAALTPPIAAMPIVAAKLGPDRVAAVAGSVDLYQVAAGAPAGVTLAGGEGRRARVRDGQG